MSSSFSAILALSVIGHFALLAFLPEEIAPQAVTLASSEIVLEAPPAPPPPPPPPPVDEPPPPARSAPAPAPTARAPKPTVLEESTHDTDVKIDAEVGTTASMPAAPAPIAVPEPIATPAPVPPPPPSVPAGPVIVPSKSLGKLPRAPALDAELERNYPADAKRAGISGSAMLRVQVLADGRLGKVERLSESHPGFGSACEHTVRAARWDPPLDREGRAVATEVKYVCKFQVRG